MNAMVIALGVLFAALCVFLIAIILMQSGRSAGLGAVGGTASADNTYWNKNKGRSVEGTLERYTKIGAALFFIIAFSLSLIMM